MIEASNTPRYPVWTAALVGLVGLGWCYQVTVLVVGVWSWWDADSGVEGLYATVGMEVLFWGAMALMAGRCAIGLRRLWAWLTGFAASVILAWETSTALVQAGLIYSTSERTQPDAEYVITNTVLGAVAVSAVLMLLILMYRSPTARPMQQTAPVVSEIDTNPVEDGKSGDV